MLKRAAVNGREGESKMGGEGGCPFFSLSLFFKPLKRKADLSGEPLCRGLRTPGTALIPPGPRPGGAPHVSQNATRRDS